MGHGRRLRMKDVSHSSTRTDFQSASEYDDIFGYSRCPPSDRSKRAIGKKLSEDNSGDAIFGVNTQPPSQKRTGRPLWGRGRSTENVTEEQEPRRRKRHKKNSKRYMFMA